MNILLFFIKRIFDYRTYLIIGSLFVIVAPFADAMHWSAGAVGYCLRAFSFYTLACLLLLLEMLLTRKN